MDPRSYQTPEGSFQRYTLDPGDLLMIRRFSGEYEFLSNFQFAPVRLDGNFYNHVENAFQAAKTLDPESRKQIRESTPRKAKQLGQHVKLRPEWESIKVRVMLDLVTQKFTHYDHFYNRLMATDTQELIEGNTWHDNFWGICSCGSCPPSKSGPGKNRLGIILMSIRQGLAHSDRA